MAETAKLLNPEKSRRPRLEARCSLASSITAA
jgi:quinolinate synthase